MLLQFTYIRTSVVPSILCVVFVAVSFSHFPSSVPLLARFFVAQIALRRFQNQHRILLGKCLPHTFRCLLTANTYRQALSLHFPSRSFTAEITRSAVEVPKSSNFFDLVAASLYRPSHPRSIFSDLRKKIPESMLPSLICLLPLLYAAISRLCAAISRLYPAKRHSEQDYISEIWTQLWPREKTLQTTHSPDFPFVLSRLFLHALRQYLGSLDTCFPQPCAVVQF
jgi:hypothetical protein